MANIKSAQRRARTEAKANLRNRAIKSEIKTLAKKFQTALDAGEKEAAEALFKEYTGALDKAAIKGTLHRNSANRKKAQISKAMSLNA
ncbi:MAG: 30S ribosomal protein S20 [Christensenellales bacterium]